MFFKLALIKFLICANCFAIAFEEIDIYGDSNYSKQGSHKLTTSVKADYKIKIYEHRNKKYLIHLGGTINTDYDHFLNVVRVDGFTGIGIDF